MQASEKKCIRLPEWHSKLGRNYSSFFRSHKLQTKIKIWWNCLMHDLLHRAKLKDGSLHSVLRCHLIAGKDFLPAPQNEDVAMQRS